jgi:protein-L-isoaspartate(D-aspartate) O-methyltransferase
MPDWDTRRRELVDRLAERRDLDPATAEAMRAVPRQEFVPESQRGDAYTDRPLPIGEGQTISAPHMVAIMTDLLALEPGMQVLEIGTGRGYHAAVTAEMVGAEGLYTVEYHAPLADAARRRLAATGYEAISVRHGDGTAGWPEHAPYDRAYLTCAAEDFPPAVVDQVRPGGLVLAPLGGRRQRLVRASKAPDGSLDRADHGGVRFVPLQ